MRKIHRFLFFVCGIVMLLNMVFPICAAAAGDAITLPSGTLKDYKKYTESKMIFYTEATPTQKFVILDSDADGFLIIADQLYGLRVFDEDGTQKFDISDPNNIAYYLNNEFLQDENMLPAEIKDYIDYERVWDVEQGFSKGNCPKAYKVKCGVSLLSYAEFMKYFKKFGLQDDNCKNDWYLRSPLATSGAPDTGIMCGGGFANEGRLVGTTTIIQGGIKPVFWVKRDFFKNVRLNISRLGDEASKLIRKSIRLEEIQKSNTQYSAYELKRFGYPVKNVEREYIDIEIPNSPTYTQNSDDAYFNVGISISGASARKYNVEYSLSGTFNDTVSETHNVTPYKKSNIKVDLSKVKKGKYDNFSVRVVSDEGVVAIDTKPVLLMKFYERQPLDEYSRQGINFDSDSKTTKKRFTEYHHWISSVMGLNNIRAEHRWGWMEDPRDNVSFNKHEYWDDLPIKYNMQYNPFILGYGNDNYYTGGVKTYQNAVDNINFQRKMVEYLNSNGTNVTSLEIWNEPNLIGYWGSNSWVTYSQFANKIAYDLKNEFPEKEMIGASIASQQGENYLDAYFRRGALMYVDGFSCHPYIDPSNPDERQLKRASDFVFRRYEAGGWMTVSQTEVGFPTQTTQGGVSREVQAVYTPKLFVYNDELDVALTNLYTLDNVGYDDRNREHEFGLFTYDYEPKDVVASISQLNSYIGNAEYIGRFPIYENSYAYVYTKLDKIFAIIWSVGDDFEYSLEKGVFAEDYFGNEIIPDDNGKITVGETMIFLNNISEKFAVSALADEAKTVFETIKKEYFDKADLLDIDNLAAEFTGIENLSAAELEKKISRVYEYGLKLIDANKGKTETKQLTAILFRLHQFCQGAAAYWSSFDLSYASSNNKFADLTAEIEKKKGDEPESSILFTDAMMRYAKRYNKKANEIANNYKTDFGGKHGAVSVNHMLSAKVMLWAEKMLEFEKVDTSRPIFTFLEDADPTVYQGQTFTYGIEIENLRNADINGQLVWKDDNGNVLGEPTECIVASGKCEKEQFTGTIPADFPLGTRIFYVEIIENGETLKTMEMNVTVKGIVDMELVPAEETFPGLSEVSVDIKSTYNEKLMGTLEITPPEGWTLEKTSKRFVLDPDETQRIKLNISQAKQVPFNQYDFGFTIKDHTGKELMTTKVPLNFLVAVKAENEIDVKNFNGDISGWENAYPIFCNIPEDPASPDAWKDANIAMKAMVKWDDKYLYTLVDVYDNRYCQSYTGNDLWRGDSIQLALDTVNDKAEKFVGDDYEYGFSYTAAGFESRGFIVGTGKTIGEKPADWFMVVRDDESNITRYLVKLPKGEIAPMQMKPGTKFGFNVCANDADIQDRDSYIQFTMGIADGKKDPSKFKTFTLVGNTKIPASADGKEYGFITKIKDTGIVNLLK